MANKVFGAISIDPSHNPAVLDTKTWDKSAIEKQIVELGSDLWSELYESELIDDSIKTKKIGFHIHTKSAAFFEDTAFLLAEFCDNQMTIVSVTSGSKGKEIGNPFYESRGSGYTIRLYEANLPNIATYISQIDMVRGPRPLGYTPRIGIGTRMSTSLWPAIFSTMWELKQPSNAIQNSLRELRLLPELLDGKKPDMINLYSFGEIEEGHTGSTFEGLWLDGVLSALKSEQVSPYGADADHIVVGKGSEGISRAKRIVDSAQHYTFFTIDVSNIVNYEALLPRSVGNGSDLMVRSIESENLRKRVTEHHKRPYAFGNERISISADDIGRCVGKYWHALDALGEVQEYIEKYKGKDNYDLELSIDESPGMLKIEDILTTPKEIVFLIREFKRREIPITHLAPNFGVEKGTDYRMPGGLDELGKRIDLFYKITKNEKIMLDCHSGDHLLSSTRRIFGKSTEGNIHFKISPILQEFFAETLVETDRENFDLWWNKTHKYVEKLALNGSPFAQSVLESHDGKNSLAEPSDKLFYYYHYASVGKMNNDGCFDIRDMFYSLDPDFYSEYSLRVGEYLSKTCNDVYGLGT